MKKIMSLILSLILIFGCFVISSSAETSLKDWAKNEGPVDIFIDDEGTKILFEDQFCFYYYKKQVNVRDFTVKIQLNSPLPDNWGYWIITIGSGKYAGSDNGYSNVIFLWPTEEGVISVDPQILFNGTGNIEPTSKKFKFDYLGKDITIRGKKVNDTTYSLDFNNGEFYYEYSIPKNFNFVECLGNGMGYLGFSGVAYSSEFYDHEDGLFNIIVKEINGVKMNVKNSSSSSNSSSVVNSGSGNTNNDKTSSTTTSTNSDKNNSTTTNINSDKTNSTTDSINSDVAGGETTDAATDINNNTSKNNKKTNKNTSQKNNTIIIFIVVLLLIVNIVIIAILLINKKKTKIAVEKSEDLEELQE